MALSLGFHAHFQPYMVQSLAATLPCCIFRLRWLGYQVRWSPASGPGMRSSDTCLRSYVLLPRYDGARMQPEKYLGNIVYVFSSEKVVLSGVRRAWLRVNKSLTRVNFWCDPIGPLEPLLSTRTQPRSPLLLQAPTPHSSRGNTTELLCRATPRQKSHHHASFSQYLVCILRDALVLPRVPLWLFRGEHKEGALHRFVSARALWNLNARCGRIVLPIS